MRLPVTSFATGEDPAARILDVSPDAYHRVPAFSASIAKVMIAEKRSPLHAKLAYDRSMTRSVDSMTDVMIRGAVLHHMTLGSGARFAPVPFDDYRTKAAKDTRDSFLRAGVIPVLAPKLEEYERAAKEIKERLVEAGIRLDGRSEVAIEWSELGVTCRCMIDHFNEATGEIIELKIRDDCSPNSVERSSENMGYRIAAAAYIRAAVAYRPELMGGIRFRFAFAEPVEPYALYAPEPDGPFLETGERDWLRAVRIWGECERSGRWPHYEDHATISRPQWKLRQEGYQTDEW